MQTPELRVINKDISLLGIIDTYTSGQFERSSWEVGKMELHVGLLDQGADALRVGNIVMIDERRAWEITGIKQTEDRQGWGMVAYGQELKGILGRRLVVPASKDDQHHFGWDRVPGPSAPDVPVETIIKHYVDKHAINPDDPKRALPGLVLAPDLERGMLTRWSDRFTPLTETLKDIGEFSGMGYAVWVDLSNKQFVLDVIPERDQVLGTDHPVVLSVGYENIENLTYLLDTSRDVSVAYVGGAGEDEERLIQTVGRTAEDEALTGHDRREDWLDCGSIDEIDDLIYEAQYRLAQMERTESVTCEVMPNQSFEYMTDWDLGSVITVKSDALGIMQAQKVTAVREVYERGRVQVYPTLGKRSKTIIDEIRKQEVIR